MSEQFEQLEILYKQILFISKEVKKYIDKSDFDEVLSKENYKSTLMSRVFLAQKTVSLNNEEKEIIENLKSQILSSEENNIKVMEKLRDNTMIELKLANNQSKITNKYITQSDEPQEGTICDYTSD